MKKEDLQKFIKESIELPALIGFYNQFREKITNPDTPASEIAQIIASDQVVVSRLLRIANSPFYGLMHRITTVAHAIVIIGFNGVHYIVLNMAVSNFFCDKSHEVKGFDVASVWKHSLATAVIAKIVARQIHYPSSEEIFTAGLLHDIGKVFLYKYFPVEFAEIIRKVKEDSLSMREAEESIFGISHAEIGHLLLHEWNFPEVLIDTTAYHHNPILAKDKAKAASIVHVADIVCHAFELGEYGDRLIPVLNNEAWQQLGVQMSLIDTIALKLDGELAHSSVFDW